MIQQLNVAILAERRHPLRGRSVGEVDRRNTERIPRRSVEAADEEPPGRGVRDQSADSRVPCRSRDLAALSGLLHDHAIMRRRNPCPSVSERVRRYRGVTEREHVAHAPDRTSMTTKMHLRFDSRGDGNGHRVDPPRADRRAADREWRLSFAPILPDAKLHRRVLSGRRHDSPNEQPPAIGGHGRCEIVRRPRDAPFVRQVAFLDDDARSIGPQRRTPACPRPSPSSTRPP